jgi:two-component system LytT family response regulator
MRKYIVIRTEVKFKKIFIDEILYCKAERSYTKIYMNNEEFITSKILKEIEEKLADYNFFRINKSYLVNLDHCYELFPGEKPEVVLSNNTKLSVSRLKMKFMREVFCVYS